jgi:hypothetical protein
MKKQLLMVLYFAVSCTLYSQTPKKSFLGIWQAGQKEVTSMYFDTYEFLNDSTFIFRPNGYNGLNRVTGIGGKYKIYRDTIYFTPSYTLELTGGYPIRSMTTTESDSWEITNAKVKKSPCKQTMQQASFKVCNEEKCILIDERKFFLIEK